MIKQEQRELYYLLNPDKDPKNVKVPDFRSGGMVYGYDSIQVSVSMAQIAALYKYL